MAIAIKMRRSAKYGGLPSTLVNAISSDAGRRQRHRRRRPPQATTAPAIQTIGGAGDDHPRPVELPPSWHSQTKEPTVYTLGGA